MVLHEIFLLHPLYKTDAQAFFLLFLHINGIGCIHSTWKQSKAHSADPHGFKPFRSELMHSVFTSTLQPVHYVYTNKYDVRTKRRFFFFHLYYSFLIYSIRIHIYVYYVINLFDDDVDDDDDDYYYYYHYYYIIISLLSLIFSLLLYHHHHHHHHHHY